MIYILVTGTRDVKDRAKAENLVRSLLSEVVGRVGVHNLVVIHGAADGIDSLFQEVCEDEGIETESWPAHLFHHPFARNEFMVNLAMGQRQLGHEAVCWAFAREWASGTGHCARKARRAGLTVTDYGVNTADRTDPF
jgi:hypothetical protein